MSLMLLLLLLASPARAQQTLCDARTYRTLMGTAGGYPQKAATVDLALASDQFINRFASFINARFNPVPGRSHGEDAVWYVARHVLKTGRPWRDVFVGPFKVPNQQYPVLQEDPQGLGYFTSEGWLTRYAGNEEAGLLLVAAARVLQNTLGLQLTAAANNNAAGQDNGATGRRSAACAGCHFNSAYALDPVAQLLPKKKLGSSPLTFLPASPEPQAVLNTSIASFRQLMERLVASDAFAFRTCRLAFEFVYGRAEYACEAALFDRCVDTFAATGKVQDAVKTLIEDPLFCE